MLTIRHRRALWQHVHRHPLTPNAAGAFWVPYIACAVALLVWWLA